MKNLESLGVHGKDGKPFLDLAYLIAIVYNTVNHKLDVLLRKRKLSVPKFNILMVLKFQGGDNGLSQKAISEKLIVSDGNITGILDRMEKEKLLQRTPHPNDRRVNLVRLTPKGDSILEDIIPAYDKLLKDNVDTISAKDQKTLMPIFLGWAKKLI